MVVLRGTNNIHSLSHTCINHGNHLHRSAIDAAQSLQTTLTMSQSALVQRIHATQINMRPYSNVSVQFIPQQLNHNQNLASLKHEQNPRFSNRARPTHQYRAAATSQSRAECYHPVGSTGTSYMPSTAAGAQTAMRVQTTPQPAAPAPTQQDISKTTMAGHNYVSPQTQTQPQTRPPQYPNFQYRPTQHGTRPNTHSRQQQPFLAGSAPTASGPVMYHPFVLPHMGIPPSYQQPRSTNPGSYYQFMPYITYTTQPSHTSPYYYPPNNHQQMPTTSIPGSQAGARSSAPTLVSAQGTPPSPATPISSSLPPAPPQQTPPHQPIPARSANLKTRDKENLGIRPTQQKRPSYRLAIIDPVTQQDIFSELYTNEQYSGESSERQTPQPEATPSIAEEFTRMVNEVANQPTVHHTAIKTNYVSKDSDIPVYSETALVNTQSSSESSNNNDIIKSDVTVNDNKNLESEVAERTETPVVSAISNSPVIVPKITNVKQPQKNNEQNVQSINVDTNVPSIKSQKQNKIKAVVPQIEEVDKSDIRFVISNTPVAANASPVTTVEALPTKCPALAAAPQLNHATSEPDELPAPCAAPEPQPQNVQEPKETLDSQDIDDKHVDKHLPQEIMSSTLDNKPNGPVNPVVISSIDSLPEVITQPTSQSSQSAPAENTKNPVKQPISTPEVHKSAINKIETEKHMQGDSPLLEPTPTQLLEAGIEKVVIKQLPTVPECIVEESKEESSAIQAQAKLTQSLASCLRTAHPDSKMKNINLNNKTTDPDTANGNPVIESAQEDCENEEVVEKLSLISAGKMDNNETMGSEAESFENGKDETDKVTSNVEQLHTLTRTDDKPADDEEDKQEMLTPTPKYNYSPGSWSPMNTSGKKCYEIGLLRQLKEDPVSKTKPASSQKLESCNVIRTSPMEDTMQQFIAISRPINDSLFPQFAKGSGMSSRSNTLRDPKKDGRNMPSGKGSTKLSSPVTPGGGSSHKPVIHVSLSLRDEVKLNETKDPWKPLRFKKDNLHEEEFQTEELYKKFRGILNKLTPQKFDTLLDKVKTLEINNQKRLEGVIDLVFEKAIEEPNFSKAYANMCNKLSMLKVPADNATSAEQCVNFRALIISRCQKQFVTNTVDDQVAKLEKDVAECSDPAKKKELTLMLTEEQRRVRMRSVGNVRFIGELYKLKMLTAKIMVYCMNYLIEKLEEEKLECLCKLLTTIGEQVESEVKEPLDMVFKKMSDIVERKANKVSSRVRFMIQDVIELRRRKWVAKSVVIDSQPKMMDQIQKEAEQQQRHIELMNANPGSGFGRRDDGGRGKRGGSDRRQNSGGGFMDSNQWKTTASRTNYTVDTSKFKAVTTKNIANIKLAPTNTGWNYGSGTKNTSPSGIGAGSNSMISVSKNMYSVLENVQADPTTLRGTKDMTPSFHSKGASIERSTFNSRGDLNSGTMASLQTGARSSSGTRGSAPTTPVPEPAPAPQAVPQERLPEAKKNSVKSMIALSLINPDDDEMVAEVKHQFLPQYHADVVTETLNFAIEKTAKEIATIAKSLLHLVSTNTISPDNFLAGMKDIFEFAPDLYIDIPMLYDYLGKFVACHIEKKLITLEQILKISETIISSNHGDLILKAILKELKEEMGPSFVKSKWQESGLQLTDWMSEDQVAKWIKDNKFEFLEGGSKASEESKKILTPVEGHKKLLELMNADESCDCIKGWVQDNIGLSSNEEWFTRALIQAVCEHALFGAEGRDVPHFNQDRMSKYSRLINEFGAEQRVREASCLFGIQQLIHRLEHPQGLSLEIFQYLHEQYIISPEGFIAWEESELEPEGKGVMMKALTSFFTNIKEADNEDSGSED